MENIIVVSPVEYKNNKKRFRDGKYAVIPTCYGEALIAAIDNYVCAIYLLSDLEESLIELRSVWRYTNFEESDELSAEYSSTFMSARIDSHGFPLLMKGTSFQISVWKALMHIPYASTCSYNQIAGDIARQNSCRAVGSAIGKNEIAMVVPCHRVVHANGEIGNYRWGTRFKVDMINTETERKPEGLFSMLF